MLKLGHTCLYYFTSAGEIFDPPETLTVRKNAFGNRAQCGVRTRDIPTPSPNVFRGGPSATDDLTDIGHLEGPHGFSVRGLLSSEGPLSSQNSLQIVGTPTGTDPGPSAARRRDLSPIQHSHPECPHKDAYEVRTPGDRL